MSLIIRLAISAVALWIATLLISGVQITTDSTGEKILTLVFVALIFGAVNAVLRPIIKTVGCAFYVLTLGLISLVVNGLLFMLTSWIAGEITWPFRVPFHVENFWPSAVLGALIVGLVSWLISIVVPDKAQGR